MNSTPRPPTAINTRGHPPEFQQIITEKSKNFVDRPFIFTAINEFLHKYSHGYFTLIGAPGSGKSAILAKYVTENPHVIYYNAQIEGKNRADQFLSDICTQLINQYPPVGAIHELPLPDNATEGSWFLSLLLQQISDTLEPNQSLIIAIDALDAIAPNSQSASSNLFYLPRYLPEKVYFLLTRRPFVKERSRLLIEAPSHTLDLKDYPSPNREDVEAYIEEYLKESGVRSQESGEREQNLRSWLNRHQISEHEFCDSVSEAVATLGASALLRLRSISESSSVSADRLAAHSENNFMYLSQILPALTEGFYSEPFQFDQLPPGLEAYYHEHWQRMAQFIDLTPLSHQGIEQSNALAILNILVQQEQPISIDAIAQTLDQDEYEVEEVLEDWIEFLQQQQIDGEIRYSLYHSSFCNWLQKQLNFVLPP